MKRKNEKKTFVLPTILTACLLFTILIGGTHFLKYLKAQTFEERTSQLIEVTSQVQVNLCRGLDGHWNFLTAADNLLKQQEFDSAKDAMAFIGETEKILGTDIYDSTLMLLDSKGSCYHTRENHGVWQDIDKISGSSNRYSFISNSTVYQGNYWMFVQKLDTEVSTRKDSITFTHIVLMKDFKSLAYYYNSSAYGNHNETYILKSDGTRMHDDFSHKNTISAYNILKSLEEMKGQKYSDLSAALKENDTISANFEKDGEEYYYCITSLKEYDTLVMFLIPARFVAVGTVKMMYSIIFIQVFVTALIIILLTVVVIAAVQRRNSVRLLKQEQMHTHMQEEMNAQLKETNARLTDAKTAAEEAFRIAEYANHAKSSFLSNMSHDIRTPMNAIIGFSSLLARDADDPEKVRDYTKKITSSGQHLLGLINDILDISKIEAGKTMLNMSDENIVDLIEGIDAIIRPQMKAKGHTFEVYSKELKHENVVMDKLRLNQILINLLSNAVKYTPDGGHITLTIQELSQQTSQLAYYRFVVEDNGYGMSEEYLKKLFLAFTREEDSITNKIQGTGLGMPITKNLIDLMGGTIAVESEKGKGSKFTVDLNLQISEHEIDHNFWKNNNITRLLAVDDEEVICQNIQLVMEDTGVTVDYALDGQTAIDKIKQSESENHRYNVVLLDWKMPGMDGLETAKRIRQEIPADIPIIILTAYDWTEIEDNEAVINVDAFLPKPFFLTSFRQKVDTIINQHREPEEIKEQSILEGMHILVAEDNEINAEILGELLNVVGASCEICENGQLVAKEFEKSAPGQYQLILMDVQMPVMNGYEATKAIRNLNHPLSKTIPIIAMTANAFAEDVRDALESGMNAHVTKPVDMSVLEQVIKTVLEEHEEQS